MAISYQATEWKSGDVLTATQLNNIENGIKTLAGSSNVSEDHNVTRHLSVATTWSRNGETQVPTVNSENIIMSADSSGVVINKPTTINGALTVGSATTPSTATINGTITGDVVIDGTFKIKNGDNIVLEKNSEAPSTIHIPNYLVVGKATAGDNSAINYEGNVTFNTATTSIHGNTSIDNLTVENKINGLTIGNVTSDSITNSGNLISNSITNSGNLTVGTAGTATVEGVEVPTYTGTATFNTENITMHGTTTIDNCNATAVTVTSTANVNTNLIVGTDATPGSANIKGTLIASGITTLNNNLIVGSNEIPCNANIYGNLTIGKATTEEVNGNQTTTYTGAATFNTQATTIHGTTMIENLIVSNPITHAITASNLTITGNTNSLIVGTAEVNNDGNITQATGQTILHGTTTIDNLVIGTAEIREIGENNEEQITQATGSAVLHGSVQIDNLHAGQLVSGTPPEYNELNEMTKEPEGSTTLYGTTIVNALQAETLDVDIFNGVEVPSLPIDEDSTEEVKPYKDGIYTLQLTITNGEPSYSWVAIGGAES